MPTTRPVKPSAPAQSEQPNSATRSVSAAQAASATPAAPGTPAAAAAHAAPGTPRSQAKENRRQALLAAAAGLFALHGFNRVSLEDLGAAAGVSGPAVYRHFQGKQAVLGDLLLTVSRELLDGGRRVIAETTDPLAALRRLVGFQVEFALGKPDVIRVQDRDFSNLSQKDQSEVRALQRNYVEIWVEVLALLHPGTDAVELRMRAHATFGLINSTPHSVRNHGRKIAPKTARPLLESMALAALTVNVPQAS
ncbi:SACE_7040 family transcriptional regulator [Pseudarthrobacter cellobiosi]|uniref:SACE_7040 family transcriptional regulator n=1 Tax=Pseudarthrobacter cellobiosi TaxID=2953654 RepID=UPI0027E3AB49|nr:MULTISPECIES: TetR family transcriptional regulator [unclassified Pseudarthrobacter]